MAQHPVAASGARIFGAKVQEMRQYMQRKKHACPIWLRRSEVSVLGLDTIVPGIVANSTTYSHVSHLTDPHSINEGTVAVRQLPLNHYGSIIGCAEGFVAASTLLRANAFPTNYFVPTSVLAELGAKPTAAAEAASRHIHVGPRREKCFNAADTTAAELFTAESCVEYHPIFFPSLSVARLRAPALRLLTEKAHAENLNSLLWVKESSAATFLLTPCSDASRGTVDLGPELGGTFINGDCFAEDGRVFFYEMYRPVNGDLRPLRERALFACCAYNNRITNPVWLAKSVAVRSGLTFPPEALAIDVPVHNRVMSFLSVQQSTNPKMFKWTTARARSNAISRMR